MWSKFVQEERWAISYATLSPGSWSSTGMPHCGQGHVHASKWPLVWWWWSVAVSLLASAGLLPQYERGHEGSSSRRGRNTNRRILQPCLLLSPCLSLKTFCATNPEVHLLFMTFYLWSWWFYSYLKQNIAFNPDQWKQEYECESRPESLGVDCHTLWEHKV